MTTAVCFDLDGRLVQYEPPFPEFLGDALTEHVETAPDGLIDAYSEAFFDTFEALEPDPYEAGMRAVLAADGVGGHDADASAVVDALREREFESASVSDAARDCLDELAADDDVRLALVTDGVGDWQRAKLERVGLADAFDEVIVSYDVGGHKADGAPYDAVRERIDADEYVMVGDDYEGDVEAAREAGFVPIHYEDDENDLFAVLRAML
ncbi:HAD family hydrolase [Halomicrobium salinisoli]|uniref:HAD family hydrolase n=1 Tax=Halomicrobium salinisoli TaxID=2878391 RepID=UPI001CF054BC|nr:HAD family hydrolase [Halomicrobium salinisoli]